MYRSCNDYCEHFVHVPRAVLTALYTPGQSSALGPIHIQPLTGIKLNVDKIKHIFIVWELPIKSVFEHYKHAIHIIHRLAWALMIVDPRETVQGAHALIRNCMYHYCIFLSNSNKIFRILSHYYASLSVTCDRLVVFSGSSGFLH